jgi:hypothetical protein
MDASLRRAFLPLPRSFSLANPPFLEVMKSKHGDILVLPESSTIDDGYWNAEKMVNEKESHRLFNNAISLCSVSTILWGMQTVVGMLPDSPLRDSPPRIWLVSV